MWKRIIGWKEQSGSAYGRNRENLWVITRVLEKSSIQVRFHWHWGGNKFMRNFVCLLWERGIFSRCVSRSWTRSTKTFKAALAYERSRAEAKNARDDTEVSFVGENFQPGRDRRGDALVGAVGDGSVTLRTKRLRIRPFLLWFGKPH